MTTARNVLAKRLYELDGGLDWGNKQIRAPYYHEAERMIAAIKKAGFKIERDRP